MPKIAKELSDVQVRRLKWKQGSKAAYHAVGGVPGLLLQCRPPVNGNSQFARSWILRTTVGDRRRDLGLGGYPGVTLSMARQKAREARELIEQGIDPVARKRAARARLRAESAKQVTFREIAAQWVQKKSLEFKTAIQTEKLVSRLETYVYPHLGHLVIADIERAHIVSMLKPIWTTKTETASRMRAAVENILDLAGVEGLRSGDNPARWKGNLEHTFPAPSKITTVKHFPALPYQELPAFWQELTQKQGISSLAVQFAILTCTRSKEARQARWDEFDFDRAIWSIDGYRTKNGRDHRIPLCRSALEILASIPRDSEYVFHGRTGNPLSDMALLKVVKELRPTGATVHGMRAAFKTWCTECTSYPDEASELALSHVESSATRAAYARSELLDLRRPLMDEWERYCLHGSVENSSNILKFGPEK